ncbi:MULTISPECIES: DUF2905 domain-containing protein [Thermodesulfovibrio]|uniref:DUF2905 domain-containing protein n=1 Tax=Thermodesulfovibrio yellowstonii (strain ATCC 51303 / DSM 11347 / YP87) TaxID=289376 RepID=B5YKE7_THEYD|nr:DUF2905 domain-containing protein [Thermodesulfovibrio yellowstonii]ACI20979.1 conserved hypothetical protein [Thermodesulfovibrio yellowstonii DSM 11347]MDI6865740.1 DUF2905 domain-containing protein [Thermodesulfovibrio yellowstonii]
MNEIGKFLILIGIITIIIGLILMLTGKIPFIGRLPGDIVIERKNFIFYFPLGTSILLSIIISLIFYLLSRK